MGGAHPVGELAAEQLVAGANAEDHGAGGMGSLEHPVRPQGLG